MNNDTVEYMRSFFNNDETWVKYYSEALEREPLGSCKTVADVEALKCCKCSKTGHWGWCDDNATFCIYKVKIKEILGIKQNQHSRNIVDTINEVIK